jgi:hypothetical protein
MHLCKNGQKTMVLPSADKARLTRFVLSKKISSKRPSLAANYHYELVTLQGPFANFY